MSKNTGNMRYRWHFICLLFLAFASFKAYFPATAFASLCIAGNNGSGVWYGIYRYNSQDASENALSGSEQLAFVLVNENDQQVASSRLLFSQCQADPTTSDPINDRSCQITFDRNVIEGLPASNNYRLKVITNSNNMTICEDPNFLPLSVLTPSNNCQISIAGTQLQIRLNSSSQDLAAATNLQSSISLSSLPASPTGSSLFSASNPINCSAAGSCTITYDLQSFSSAAESLQNTPFAITDQTQFTHWLRGRYNGADITLCRQTVDLQTLAPATFAAVLPNTGSNPPPGSGFVSPCNSQASVGSPSNTLSSGTLDALSPLKMFGTSEELCDQLSTPRGFLSRVLEFAFPLAGMILFVMLLWSGFEIVSGATGTQGLNAGKQRATAAIGGFLLLFSAYWIIQLLEVIFNIAIF